MLSLVVFSTTKGNFHQTDIFKTVVDDLFAQVNPNIFDEKWAHIKDGGESDLDAMLQEYRLRDISCVVSKGSYKHFNQSHADEYTKDICSIAKLIQSEYVLMLEADWIFRLSKNNPRRLNTYIQDAMGILKEHPEYLCVRFPHELYDDEIFKSNPAQIYGYTLHLNNFFYSLNPHILRTGDLKDVTEFIQINNSRLSPHIEWKFTQAFQIISKWQEWFAAFDPKEIRARHIGLPDWKNVLTKIEQEYV